ncbi:PREDICTED: uncharacterized protein LOC105118038, partial [Populus euphratica]|uniref:Uncharacterized protein LOC105118038 n=1 Tax=Populus euphratica TaxID=75702 RepID=A0AAJ6TMZ0_POPEU
MTLTAMIHISPPSPPADATEANSTAKSTHTIPRAVAAEAPAADSLSLADFVGAAASNTAPTVSNQHCPLDKFSRLAWSAWCPAHFWTIKTPQNCSWAWRKILKLRSEWHDIVWFKNAVPRHSFLLWVAVQQKLTTQDRLHRF